MTFPNTGARDAVLVTYPQRVHQAVEDLIALGPLPPDDAPLDEQRANQYSEALDALPTSPAAEEAVALLTVFPPDETTSFGAAWTILHTIEASPAWSIWDALDDRNWWVTYLRERCERAGMTRPI